MIPSSIMEKHNAISTTSSQNEENNMFFNDFRVLRWNSNDLLKNTLVLHDFELNY
jgi:hypothetical protein